MTCYIRKFKENTTMSLRFSHEQLLKNHFKIWGKFKNLMKIILKLNLFMVMMINI